MAAVLVVLVIVTAQVLPVGVDWESVYRPATRALLKGDSPFEIERVQVLEEFYSVFYNPPWALIPLIPFALLPAKLGHAALVYLGIGAFGYSAYRLGAKLHATVAFCLSPPVLACLLHGNVDWMPVLGFVLPPRWGLFFVLVKPQMGMVVALFWVVEAWRKGGIRAVAELLGPLVAVTLVTFLFYGLWPLDMGNTIDAGSESNAEAWNASLWPSVIPVGVALVVAALKHREVRCAMGASPCLSPYVSLQSWSGALAAVAHLDAVMLGAVAGFWGLVLVRALGG
jgi:hypothetical protein